MAEGKSLLVAALPDWPSWALNLLVAMSALLIVVLIGSGSFSSSKDTGDEQPLSNGDHSGSKKKVEDFNSFRRRYVVVYNIIMLADWMQGTHMYTLYLSYGVNVSALFLTGFFSGAVFAPFLGSAVDKFGRKRSCIVYCILEIIINVMEHSTDFTTLLVGRVLGGISTNLLFSAFESWMTTEHRKKKFPESWLAKTYSATSIGNGTMAILAGIVAQILEDNLGHIGPFQGAIALTVLAMVLIMVQWEENYGEKNGAEDKEASGSSLYGQFILGWKTTCSDSKILRIGLTQSLSEGAMYTFVFMWVPTLLSLDPPGGLPTGCVFSALMMAITIGGILFPPLQNFLAKNVVQEHNAEEAASTIIYIVASIAMAFPAWCISKLSDGSGGSMPCLEICLVSFVLVELCVGLFMPVAGTLRSKYVPDNLQGAILNIFRLPLNAIVVLGTRATDVMAPHYVFMLVSTLFLSAGLLQATMISSKVAVSTSSKKKN